MVGHMPLKHGIGVRVPARQPIDFAQALLDSKIIARHSRVLREAL